VSVIDTKSRFTDLVPGWAPTSPIREAQVARLQSHLERARRELAGRHLEQLALFRRPRLDASSRAAQEWLDRILIPDEPEEASFIVSVVSSASYDGPCVGLWRGFRRCWFGGISLMLADPEHPGCTTHIAPGNIVSVEVLELVWEPVEDQDDW
jgi:hypothetical protein